MRRRKLWARSVLGLQIDGNAIFTCKNITQQFLPQPSSTDRHSLGLSAVVPSVIPASPGCLLGDVQQHGLLRADLGSVDITVRNHSAIGRRQFSPRQCHRPSSHAQSQVQRTLYGQTVHFFPISAIFHSPAALALCVWLYYPTKESLLSSL